MSGFLVQPGAVTARAGAVDAASAQVADVAGAVGRVDVGGMPPRTGAALESALAAWPAAIRRLGRALDATADSLRAAEGAYGQTDAAVGRAASGGRP
jgi:hypothetical protein